jgi:hypothetical protein
MCPRYPEIWGTSALKSSLTVGTCEGISGWFVLRGSKLEMCLLVERISVMEALKEQPQTRVMFVMLLKYLGIQ